MLEMWFCLLLYPPLARPPPRIVDGQVGQRPAGSWEVVLEDHDPRVSRGALVSATAPALSVDRLGGFPGCFLITELPPGVFPFCGALITRIAELQRFLA